MLSDSILPAGQSYGVSSAVFADGHDDRLVGDHFGVESTSYRTEHHANSLAKFTRVASLTSSEFPGSQNAVM
jgi:hypothetical protein